MTRRLASRLLDLVWPRKCVVCRRILEEEPGILCPDCRKAMPEPENGPRRGEHFSRCVSVCSYEGAWRESILRYKFAGKRMYARAYGPLLAEVIRRELEGEYELLSYVPLSPKRRRDRGYDQARLLACAAAKELGRPAVCLLRKTRHTAPQSGIRDSAARRANILGAYTVEKSAEVAGRRILLIDDILTSGSTLSEASRVLLQAGAASVVCATLALTPHRQ